MKNPVRRTLLFICVVMPMLLLSVGAWCELGPPPTLYSVTPNSGTNAGMIYALTVHGSDLEPDLSVKLVKSGQPDIVASDTYVSGNVIYCNFNFIYAQPGMRDLVVTNPDNQSATLYDAFEVLNPAPEVWSIDKYYGYDSEVIEVQIQGSYFREGIIVKLKEYWHNTEIVATDVTLLNSNSLTCKFDLNDATLFGYDLVVTNSDGQYAYLNGAFSVYGTPWPGVTSVSPDEGYTNNSSLPLTIYGDWFFEGCTVKLGKNGTSDISATDVVVVDINTITCKVDLTGAVTGQWSLYVTDPDGGSGEPGWFYITAPTPEITSVTPSALPREGTTTVTVKGKYFQATPQVEVYRDYYGSLWVGNVQFISDTEIKFDIQTYYNDPGMYTLRVYNPDWQCAEMVDALQVLPPPPSIDYIQPYISYNSRPLTDAWLYGSYFVPGLSVKFTREGQSDIIALVKTVNENAIQMDVDLTGAKPGYWNIMIEDPNGQSCIQEECFYVEHLETPTLTGISPNSGTYFERALEVTLTGTGFYEDTIIKLMRDGEEYGQYYTYSISGETAYCEFDLGNLQPGIYDVVIENPDGQQAVLNNGFTVNAPPPPTVTSISPNISPGLAQNFHMTINGSNFSEYVEITLVHGTSSIKTFSITIPDSDTIECVWSFYDNEPGLWDVIVTNSDGQSATLPAAFELLPPAPQLTGAVPTTGLQGTVLEACTLVGNYFQPGAQVRLTRDGCLDITAADLNVVNENKITCTLDLTSAAAGVWSVVITNPDGQFCKEKGFVVSTGYAPDVIGQWGGLPTRTVVSGGYAYLGVGPRLIALDAAEDGGPVTNPQYSCVGKSSVLPGRVLSLAVSGNYAFIAADEAGLQIVDLTDPANMAHVGGIDTPGIARDITISGNLAYVADYPTGLLIFDISVPTSPVLVGELNRNDVLSTAINGQFVCVGTGYYYYIVDVGDPTAPVIVSGIPGGEDEEPPLPSAGAQSAAQPVATETGFEYMPSKVVESDGYFFIAQQSGVYIVEVSDQGNSNLIYNYSMPVLSVAAAGNRMYIALPWENDFLSSDFRSVVQFDITDPSNPVESNVLYVYDTGVVTDAYAVGQRLYMVSEGKYTMLNNGPGGSVTRSYYNWAQPISAGIADNGTAYILDGATGAKCLDVSNPASPTLQSGYYFMDWIAYERCLTVEGNTAYTSGPNDWFEVHDLSNPVMPMRVGSCMLFGSARAIAITDDYYAYVASDNYGLDVVDILDPVIPIRVGGYPTSGSRATGIALSGNYVFLAIQDRGIQTMDISIPYIPIRKGLCDTPGTANDIVISGNYAYIADGEAGLQVIDISKPAQPRLVGSCTTDGDACDIALQGSYAWVINRNEHVALFDLANPTSPRLVSIYNTTGTPASITVRDGLAYISDRQGGLLILGLPDAPVISGISPNRAQANVMVDMASIYGANFQAGAVVKLVREGQPDLLATNVNTVSPGKITCSLDLAGEAIGAWDVVVTHPNAKSARLSQAFYIEENAIDITAPTILSTTVNPTKVCRGDTICITVKAEDNTGVTEVSANGQPLPKLAGNTWQGYIPAEEDFDFHTVDVIVGDASGNTTTDSSTGYTTCPNVGITIRNIAAPLATTVADGCAFTLWGTVVSVDGYAVTISDGSPLNAVVELPGEHPYTIGDFISARGWLTRSSPPTIQAASVQLIRSH